MNFELAQKVADAVLYEGYVLYPYRASSAKNQVRWQFGVLVPRGYAESGGSDPWEMQTECLVDPGDEPRLDLRIRFLQVQTRTVEQANGFDQFRPVESLEVDGERLVTWEEGVERQSDLQGIDLQSLCAAPMSLPIELQGSTSIELVRGAGGEVRGQVVRHILPLSGVIRLEAQPIESLIKLQIRIENQTPWTGGEDVERATAVRGAMVGTHTLMSVSGGTFVSLLDPPRFAVGAVSLCKNLQTWPVLVGHDGDRSVMLSSPIILYDYPAIAPESQGDYCDATEIDEMLALRVMTLTDDEKREARATDRRARQIIERSDSIPREIFERLHGAIRSMGPITAIPELLEPVPTNVPERSEDVDPETSSVTIAGVNVAKGSRVRLHPSRRADSMDIFLVEKTARVEGVYTDVDDRTYVAVTIEDDPAADMHAWYGRYFYFYPEEVEPLSATTDPTADPSRRKDHA